MRSNVLPGPSRETNTNNNDNSNVKNGLYNAPLPNNNENEYFFQVQTKRVTKKQALQ